MHLSGSPPMALPCMTRCLQTIAGFVWQDTHPHGLCCRVDVWYKRFDLWLQLWPISVDTFCIWSQAYDRQKSCPAQHSLMPWPWWNFSMHSWSYLSTLVSHSYVVNSPAGVDAAGGTRTKTTWGDFTFLSLTNLQWDSGCHLAESLKKCVLPSWKGVKDIIVASLI